MINAVKYSFLWCAVLFHVESMAQGSYAPPAGQPGSTAMHEDSSVFIGWVDAADVVRGPMNILDPGLGNASAGTTLAPIGEPGENGVVSLGDGGTVIAHFAGYIYNGPGPDFAVFENGFDDFFLELAFVEVSSDGQNYYRFPAVSQTQTNTEVGTFDSLDATHLYNLAGKYRSGYGVPFDLEELNGTPGLNIDRIVNVRVVDVVGTLIDTLASFDSQGNKVNDPFPTPFVQGGFDLDAIGVIHMDGVNMADHQAANQNAALYPNPSKETFWLRFKTETSFEVTAYSPEGKIVHQERLSYTLQSAVDVRQWPQGLYFIRVSTDKGEQVIQFIKS